MRMPIETHSNSSAVTGQVLLYPQSVTNRRSCNFDVAEDIRPQPQLARHVQMVVRMYEGRVGEFSLRVETHHGGGDRIGGDGIFARDEHARLELIQAFDPGTFPPFDRHNTIDDRQVDRARPVEIHDHAGEPRG